MSHIVLKAYELEYSGKSIIVEHQHMEAASGDMKTLASHALPTGAEFPTRETDPLVLYILLELNTPSLVGSGLDISQKYRILMVMKTVIFAFDRSARRGIPHLN